MKFLIKKKNFLRYLKTKMSICMNISIKLLKSGFDANMKWEMCLVLACYITEEWGMECCCNCKQQRGLHQLKL